MLNVKTPEKVSLEDRIKEAIRDVHDYPKPGIVFKDIAPMLAQPALMDDMIHSIVDRWQGERIDAVAAIEARGFIFGSLLAHAMKCAFIPVRKVGKLPYQTVAQEYSLEYGTATLEMHVDAIKPGMRVLVHDDLLATGGTATATGQLIKRLDGEIAGFSFLINLGFLPGEASLKEKFAHDPFYLVEY